MAHGRARSSARIHTRNARNQMETWRSAGMAGDNAIAAASHSVFVFALTMICLHVWLRRMSHSRTHMYCLVMHSVIYGFGLIRVIENGGRARAPCVVCSVHNAWPHSYRVIRLVADMRPYGITHSVVYHDISDLLAFSEHRSIESDTNRVLLLFVWCLGALN